MDKPIVLTQPADIAAFQFLARLGALKLEVKGLRRSGRSAYSIVREVYGYRGSKSAVVREMEAARDLMLHGGRITTPNGTEVGRVPPQQVVEVGQ